jgi:hypothetical protein
MLVTKVMPRNERHLDVLSSKGCCSKLLKKSQWRMARGGCDSHQKSGESLPLSTAVMAGISSPVARRAQVEVLGREHIQARLFWQTKYSWNVKYFVGCQLSVVSCQLSVVSGLIGVDSLEMSQSILDRHLAWVQIRQGKV